jgi:hypothetical protein
MFRKIFWLTCPTVLNLKPTEVNKATELMPAKKIHISSDDDKNMTRERWYSHEFSPTSTSE